MNIAKANAIPLSEILAKMGYKPASTKQHNLWYHSPFRDERTPSFHVNQTKNVWYDHGEGMGGNAVGFICTYLQHQNQPHTTADALRWLSSNAQHIPKLPRPRVAIAPPEISFALQRVSSLQTRYLTEYIKERGINLSIAKTYLREVDFYHAETRKTFKALGFRNVENGFELRNKAFKGSIAPKDISFIRGSETSGAAIHIFEGIFDYLAALMHQKNKRFKDDVIILNSITNIGKAFPYIENHTYSTIFTWFDNDRAGMKALNSFKAFSAPLEINILQMNHIYAPHKDVNAWHIATLKK